MCWWFHLAGGQCRFLPVERGRQFAVAGLRNQRTLKRREPLLESNSLMFLVGL